MSRRLREPRIPLRAAQMRAVLEGAQTAIMLPVAPQPKPRTGDGVFPDHWTWDGSRARLIDRCDSYLEAITDEAMCRDLPSIGAPDNMTLHRYVQLGEPWALESFNLAESSCTIRYAAGGRMFFLDSSRSWIERYVLHTRRRRRRSFPNNLSGTTVHEPWYEKAPTFFRSSFLPDWAVRQWIFITNLTCRRVLSLTPLEIQACGFLTAFELAENWDRYAAGRYALYHTNPFAWIAEFKLVPPQS